MESRHAEEPSGVTPGAAETPNALAGEGESAVRGDMEESGVSAGAAETPNARAGEGESAVSGDTVESGESVEREELVEGPENVDPSDDASEGRTHLSPGA